VIPVWVSPEYIEENGARDAQSLRAAGVDEQSARAAIARAEESVESARDILRHFDLEHALPEEET